MKDKKEELQGKNIINCAVDSNEILSKVDQIPSLPGLDNKNIYGNGKAASKIINVLKTLSYE